jgi:V/A-type H+/Na+-transporting ATPase subunit E
MSVKNGISAISSEVVGDAQKEAETKILDAEKDAKETLQTAKREADKKYQELVGHAKVKAESERRKIASVTEVEMRNRILAAKEEFVDAAFEKAVAEFKTFVETKEYHTYLIKLIEDTAQKIGQKSLVVEVNSADASWLTEERLKPLSKKLHAEIKLAKSNEQFIGGCIIQTGDGKIIYNSTIDTMLEELKPTLRVEVAKILFGEV